MARIWLANDNITKPNIVLCIGRAAADSDHQAKLERPETATHLGSNNGRRTRAQLPSRKTGEDNVVVGYTTESVIVGVRNMRR
jgi:hypothetical protein